MFRGEEGYVGVTVYQKGRRSEREEEEWKVSMLCIVEGD